MVLRVLKHSYRLLQDCPQRTGPPLYVGTWIVERVDPFLMLNAA